MRECFGAWPRQIPTPFDQSNTDPVDSHPSTTHRTLPVVQPPLSTTNRTRIQSDYPPSSTNRTTTQSDRPKNPPSGTSPRSAPAKAPSSRASEWFTRPVPSPRAKKDLPHQQSPQPVPHPARLVVTDGNPRQQIKTRRRGHGNDCELR